MSVGAPYGHSNFSDVPDAGGKGASRDKAGHPPAEEVVNLEAIELICNEQGETGTEDIYVQVYSALGGSMLLDERFDRRDTINEVRLRLSEKLGFKPRGREGTLCHQDQVLHYTRSLNRLQSTSSSLVLTLVRMDRLAIELCTADKILQYIATKLQDPKTRFSPHPSETYIDSVQNKANNEKIQSALMVITECNQTLLKSSATIMNNMNMPYIQLDDNTEVTISRYFSKVTEMTISRQYPYRDDMYITLANDQIRVKWGREPRYICINEKYRAFYV